MARKTSTPARRFEQTSMFGDIAPVTRSASRVEETFPVEEMVAASIARANAIAEQRDTQFAALDALKRAIEESVLTGRHPLQDASVVRTGNAAAHAATELRHARAEYERTWRGYELATLPANVQADVMARSRVARAAMAKANGRRRARRR